MVVLYARHGLVSVVECIRLVIFCMCAAVRSFDCEIGVPMRLEFFFGKCVCVYVRVLVYV